MKATAIAPSNLAFIKYWGKKDEKLRIPLNSSISMNLSGLTTTTTVEFSEKPKADEFILDGKKEADIKRVSQHLDRVRKLAKINLKAKVVSQNNFPSGTGLSSSASGFAALTLAASTALGLSLSGKELSTFARLGSGSAARSIPAGFVIWEKGDSHQSSYSYSLYPPQWWEIADVVVVISRQKKEISTSEGQEVALSSPFLATRLLNIDKKIEMCKTFIKTKDFTHLGQLVENEALELHAVMLTCTPALIYLSPQTLQMIQWVKIARKEGLEIYFSLNTGQDVHLLVEGKNVVTLQEKLKDLDIVQKSIVNFPSTGARIINKHLF